MRDRLSDPVAAAMSRDCDPCQWHGIPCPEHAQERIQRDAERIAHLEHQVATLTVALAQTQKGGEA